MKSLFIAAASTAITDAQTNSFSLIEIIEAFEVPQLPVLVPRLTLAWLTSRDSSEPEVSEYTVELINCGNKSAFPLLVDYKGGLRHRAIVQFQGVALDAIGEFEVRIVSSIGKRTVASLSIPILLLGSQTPPPVVVGSEQPAVSAKKNARRKPKAKP